MSAFPPLGVLLLLGSASAPAQEKAVVVLDGRRQTVQRADFGIHLQAEGASYWLNVKVDEHSGEDGAPAPAAEDIPVARAAGGRHPSLQALGALTVRERPDGADCDAWEAWLGNDAPGLCGNAIRFLGWSGPHLRLRWEAHYPDRDREKPFLFEGPAVFTGIYVKVPAGQDADTFVDRIWGGQPAATLDRHLVARRDDTASYVYTPKGQPLPDYWTVQPGLTPSPAKP